MKRLARLSSTIALFAVLAASMAQAQEPPKPAAPDPPIPNRTIRLGQPFLQVIRTYGQPSRTRAVELVPIAGGKATSATIWIYERPTGVTLEILLGEDGKVLQIITRSKTLDQLRIEPKP